MPPRSCASVVSATRQPLPARVDAVTVGDADSAEKHLGEVRVAVHLPQWPHLDSGALHVETKHGDARVLRHARVGAREEQAPAGVVTAARPDLLTVDDPLVAVAARTSREAGEVGSCVGLGEELAPDLAAVLDRREPACALLVVAVREQGRTDEREADEEGIQVGDRAACELLLHHREPRAAGAHTAVLDRPGRDGPTAVGQGPEVGAPRFEVVAAGAEHRRRGAGGAGRQARRERGSHLRPLVVEGRVPRF